MREQTAACSLRAGSVSSVGHNHGNCWGSTATPGAGVIFSLLTHTHTCHTFVSQTQVYIHYALTAGHMRHSPHTSHQHTSARPPLAPTCSSTHVPPPPSALHQVIRPFMLRRTKREVEKELPNKTQHVIKTGLSAWQQAQYDQLKKEVKGAQGCDTRTGVCCDLCCGIKWLCLGCATGPWKASTALGRCSCCRCCFCTCHTADAFIVNCQPAGRLPAACCGALLTAACGWRPAPTRRMW